MTDVAPSSTPAAVPAVGVDNNTYRAARAANAQAIRQAGQDPFGPVGKRFVPTHSVQQARAMAPTDPAGRSDLVMVAGRIGNLRMSGAKLVFGSLFDRSRAEAYQRQKAEGFPDVDGAEAKKERGIQLFLEAGALAACWPVVQALDLADWVGITGRVGRTRRGEITVFAESVVVLGKAHLPPPHQAGADAGHLAAETRARQRYVDLMMSDSSLSTFVMRSRIVSEIRRFFTDRGYLEVETPMMQPIPGGASARPFTTHHNALGLDLYLRIAPELYLKRLIVGGMDRVFELNRNFRNEGISPRHNPEFTMIEWYEAYADHHVMMELSETLFRTLADKLLGTRVLNWNGMRLDLDQPWRRITYHDAMRDIGGIAYEDEASVLAKARELGLTLDEFPTYDRLANAVWEEIVEPHLIQPTFITDQPTWLTPLCRTQPDNPGRSLRFELFMARMEVGNAYTELNDPDIQRARFSEQVAEAAAAGDDEAGVVAGMVDHDFCTALDHGLPACGGQGIGIDRLVMLLTGQTNIRDVILFPTMRPHASKTTETAHP